MAQLDEEIGENIESVKQEDEEDGVVKGRIPCDGCLELHDIDLMAKTGDYYYCATCCQDWQKVTKGDTTPLQRLEAEGGYCA